MTFKGITDPVSVVRVLPHDGDPADLLRPFAPQPPPAAKRPRRWPVAVAALVAGLLVALSVPMLGGDDDATVAVRANSIAMLDTLDGTATLAEPIGERPGASAVGFGSVWVVQPDGDAVVQIDPDDGSVRDRISRSGSHRTTSRSGPAPSGSPTRGAAP